MRRAWISAKAEPINAKRIADAAAAAGIFEPVNTWAGWSRVGYEVIHGMKALFTAVLIYGSRGAGATYKASFFSASQVREVVAGAGVVL